MGLFSNTSIKKLRKKAEEVLAKEEEFKAKTDEELKAMTPLLKERLKNGETLNDIFADADAVMTGAETRTSSPVRITRSPESLQALGIEGLYPCGEGAGYAGGIMSAAVDGVRVAEKIMEIYG